MAMILVNPLFLRQSFSGKHSEAREVTAHTRRLKTGAD
jgi:hypothetical protein